MNEEVAACDWLGESDADGECAGLSTGFGVGEAEPAGVGEAVGDG